MHFRRCWQGKSEGKREGQSETKVASEHRAERRSPIFAAVAVLGLDIEYKGSLVRTLPAFQASVVSVGFVRGLAACLARCSCEVVGSTLQAKWRRQCNAACVFDFDAAVNRLTGAGGDPPGDAEDAAAAAAA